MYVEIFIKWQIDIKYFGLELNNFRYEESCFNSYLETHELQKGSSPLFTLLGFMCYQFLHIRVLVIHFSCSTIVQ